MGIIETLESKQGQKALQSSPGIGAPQQSEAQRAVLAELNGAWGWRAPALAGLLGP